MDTGTWDEALAQLHPHRNLPAGGAVPHPEVSEQSTAVASRHERERGPIEARVVRHAGSVRREGQGVRGQGEVSDAGLHGSYKAEGGDVAPRRASCGWDRGDGEAVMWWWRLHVRHGGRPSGQPSEARAAGTPLRSLQTDTRHED